ncbi:MFS transporter [Demequina sp.]|uniref:MFS transporter n=1 Tax=Demequina sp. TaxID=2050685 RepID=UPI003D119AF0
MTEPLDPTPHSAEPEDFVTEVPHGGTSLWRNRPYMALLTGETVAAVGVEIAQVALPIIAVTYLVATEFEIGVLGMAEGIAFLLLSLPVGAWVDRVSRRRVMIAANVVRGLAMAAIPILWFSGVLDVPQLMAVALIISAAAVFFDTAYMSIVPALVPRDQLNDANSRLQITSETARAAGPGLGGVLAKVFSAAWLPLAATLGYLISAFAIWRIPTDEPPPRTHDSKFRTEIREGIDFVFKNQYIRPVVLSTTASNLFGTIAYTMIPVLLLRELGLGPAAYGLMLTISSVGGIFGAFTAPWWARKFGEGHSIPVTYIFAALPMFLMASVFLLPHTAAIIAAAVSGFWGVAGIVAFNVVQVSMRQKQCPPRMLARMTASIRTLIWGVGPLGAFLSGVIATHWGLASAFWIGATGQAIGLVFLLFSPLWRLRKVPDPAWMADEDAAVGES